MNSHIINLYNELKLCESNENRCFECQLINPTFVSVKNGIFVCFLCAAIHKKFLDDSSSHVIEIKILNNNLLNEYLPYIINGGNKRLKIFYEKYELMQTPVNIAENKVKVCEKYKTNSGVYYRFALKCISEGAPTNVDPPSITYGREMNGMYSELISNLSEEGKEIEKDKPNMTTGILNYFKAFGSYFTSNKNDKKEEVSEELKFDRI